MAEPMSDERLAEIEGLIERGPAPLWDRELLAEVKRLRSTVEILWDTMNRDIKMLADDALEDAGLPSVEGGYRA